MNQISNQLHHIAIIMDGNGRWAINQNLERVKGHARGVEVAEDIITHCRELDIPYLTLYAFSKENWLRPIEEVNALMQLLKHFLLSKKQKMLDHEIRFNTIGDISKLPLEVQETISEVKEATKDLKKMTLSLALSYGARDEMIRAIQTAAKNNIDLKNISDEDLSSLLDTKEMPDPDLIIRTSGEYRTSNFLLWQAAYAEYYFEPCLWPDFTPKHFDKAISSYHQRNRRFGGLDDSIEGNQ